MVSPTIDINRTPPYYIWASESFKLQRGVRGRVAHSHHTSSSLLLRYCQAQSEKVTTSLYQDTEHYSQDMPVC